jgi:hypothetical protein
MQVTPNMPSVVASLVQFLNKLAKYEVPFFLTPIQTNFNIIAKTERKYYDKEGVEYSSTILEHINRIDGRMGLAYASLLRRNLVVAPDEWDIGKLNDLTYNIKEVLNFLKELTMGKYSEDTVVYYEYRESRGKIMDQKSKLIYLHIPTMIKLVIDPTPDPKSNLCNIVTCYILKASSSLADEFLNCSFPFSNLDLCTLLNSDEESKTWKNFVFDLKRINAKKVGPKPILKSVTTQTIELQHKTPKVRIPYADRPIQKGQIPDHEHREVFEFWDLYMEVKLSRNNPNLREGLENRKPISIKNNLNKMANVLSGTALLYAISGDFGIPIKNMEFEYKVKNANILGFDILMEDLVLQAGTLDEVPKYLVAEIQNMDPVEFYSKYYFLMGTTLSLRLVNGKPDGYYFCIPFSALKITYLKGYLKQCTITTSSHFDQDMKKWSTRYTLEELKSKVQEYHEVSRLIVESDFIPDSIFN